MSAEHVRRGDVLSHDGQLLIVTARPSQAFYREGGERIDGIAIPCRAAGGESARWTLYRRLGDVLCRVEAAQPGNSPRSGGTYPGVGPR